MKRLLAVLICMVLVVTVVPLTLPAEASASAVSQDFDGYTGIVISTKGNFENVTASALVNAGWSILEESLVTGAEDAHSGSAYLKAAAGEAITFVAGNMPKAGYMLRGYYKHMTDGTTAGSQIFMMQVNVASSNYNQALTYTTEWTKFGMMINASQMDETGSIRFTVNNGAGCATLCLDDLELVRLDNYDKRNLIQNPGFDVNPVGTATPYMYASWYNHAGTNGIVSDAHSGDSALNITSGQVYTWAPLPAANTEGKKYEFSAWIKWANGAAFAAGQSGLTAPYIGLETYEGNALTYGKDYYLTKENGITGNGWCHVKLILDAESTPVGLTNFRLFLRGGTGGTIWDDVSIRPVETALEIMDETGTKSVDTVVNDENVSYTARVQYPAAEGAADAKVYMAAYEYDADGALILKQAGFAKAVADGTTSYCTMDGVSANDREQTIIRAYLWDENNAPIETVEIKNNLYSGPVMTENFENSSTQPDNAVEWTNASVTSEESYTGANSLKLSGYNARAIFEIPDLLLGNEYTLSFWYKGTVDSGGGLVARRHQWANEGEAPAYTNTYYSDGKFLADDWTLFTYTFTQYEGTSTKIGPMLYYGSGTVYIDDIALTPTENASAARVVTDQIFYYSDLTGKGEATVKLDPRLANAGYDADISLMDGETVLAGETDVVFTDNEAVFEYNLSLLSELTKEYKVVAEIKNERGETVDTVMQQVYKYDRPSTVSKDGTFTDINGKRIDPMFMYHIPYEDFETAASAGINVMQYAPAATVEETLAQLDEMYEMGVYAGVVCYWGMRPAGNAANHDNVKAFIEQIKHHPAIFCYMVMDEPFLNNPNAYDDLRKSYIMLRTTDPARPAYICEGFPPYMKDVAKYCDIMAPDPYPGYLHADMATYVSEMVGYAHKYLNYDKPIITILQAFTQNGVKPTALELHSMMYQSLMAGGNALGYYTWAPDNAELDKNIDEDFYWPMFQAFYEEEKAVVYDYYAYGKGETFSSEKGAGNIWYESWYDESGDYIYMVVQNRDEQAAVTATVPLTSSDGKTTISGAAVEAIGYSADSVTITGKTGAFDINLEASQAVLIKITLQ